MFDGISIWIFNASLILFVLFTIYFLVFPLSKRRPILMTQYGLFIYCVILFTVLYSLFNKIFFLIIFVLLIIFIVIFKPWVIYGIAGILISDALLKAASITKTSVKSNNMNHIIDNKLQIHIFSFVKNFNLIILKENGKSKKSKLTMLVFKKFILNYFIF
jgi:hypothetical protein